MNKGRIHRELRYFWGVLQIRSKSDEELRWKITDLGRFGNRTQRRIHIIKNHSICIKIRGKIKEQILGRIFEYKERENQD